MKNGKGEYGLVERKFPPGVFKKLGELDRDSDARQFGKFSRWAENKYQVKIEDGQGFFFKSETNTIYLTDPGRIEKTNDEMKRLIHRINHGLL